MAAGLSWLIRFIMALPNKDSTKISALSNLSGPEGLPVSLQGILEAYETT